MISLTERAEQELSTIFMKFECKSFDENDIEKLLLHLRAQFKDQRLICEFASFIAHPEDRDQGVFHQALDVYWAKMKYIRDEDKLPLNIGKIEKGLFKTLIKGSIETNHERYLKEQFSLNRIQCLRQIEKSYVKKGKYYYLKTDENTELTINIIDRVVSTLNNKPIINTDKLLGELLHCLKIIAKNLKNPINVKRLIREQGNDILLCIIALTHSARFKLPEGNSGYCKLRIERNSRNMLKGILSWNLELMAIVDLEGSKTMWPVMVLENKVEQYIPEIDELELSGCKCSLPYFNAIRNQNGDLILGKK